MKKKLLRRGISFSMAVAMLFSCGGYLWADETVPEEQPSEEVEVMEEEVSVDDEALVIPEQTEAEELSEEEVIEEAEGYEFTEISADISDEHQMNPVLLVFDSGLDNDDMAQLYIEQEMNPGNQAYYGRYDYNTMLSEDEQVIFNQLYDVLSDIASGDTTSTCFELGGLSYTIDELGLSYPIDWDDFDTAMSERVDVYKVFFSMLDCFPYELYWFDKTDNNYIYPEASVSEGVFTVTYCFELSVASEYRDATSADSLYTVNSKFGKAVKAALANAENIISTYAGLDDYNKLLSYCETLLELSDYNHEAVGEPGLPYGNPWQMIWALDGDPATMVVCEGYSKAFQYLCDNTTFMCRSIYAISVQGDVWFEPDDGGGHMWNVVRMDDGENYLVDVTNYEENCPLFLEGALSGSVAGGYYVYSGESINPFCYSYDDSTQTCFTTEALELADHNYVFGESVPIDEDHFPDATFREFVTGFDENEDQYLSVDERNAVVSIDVSELEPAITTLEGIGYFPNIFFLNCSNQAIADLDLNSNTMIDFLMCNDCGLENLHIESLVHLIHLECMDNSLTSLDLSMLTTVEELNCFNNKISELKLGNNDIKYLECSCNNLSELDVSACIGLETLFCDHNSLTQLDINDHPYASIAYLAGTLMEVDGVDYYKFEYGPNDEDAFRLMVDSNVSVITEDAPGWKTIRDDWFLFDSDWNVCVGWAKSGKRWYFFDDYGKMQTGWVKDGNNWYYCSDTGAMQTGWQKIGGRWYLLKSSGVMTTGWAKSGGKWYYFSSGGVMQTGWKKISGKWYYFESSGAMKTGWIKLSNKWYYFDGNGAMVTGSRTINGKVYYFDSNGVCQNP